MDRKKILQNQDKDRHPVADGKQKQTDHKAAGKELERTHENPEDEIGSIPLGLDGHGRKCTRQQGPLREGRQTRQARSKRQAEAKKRGFSLSVLLITLAALVVFYVIGSFFIVPTLIKGPLADRLASQSGLDIDVKTVMYSPFTCSLQLANVTVADSRSSGRDLKLSIKRLLGDVSLFSFFQRQGLIKKIVIDRFDLKLVRYKGTDTSLSRLFTRWAANHPRETWVDSKWFVPGYLRVKESRITIDDIPTGKQHLIEHLDLLLPPVTGSGNTRKMTPRLRAVVNSSPVEISGHRQRKEDGTIETLLTLQSKRINVGDYISYLPSLEDAAAFEGGSGALDLEMVFADNVAGERKINLRGKVQLQDVELRTPKGDTIARFPSTFISLKVNLLSGQYQFENILFKGLEWNIPVNSGSDRKGIIPSFFRYFNQLPGGVRIDQLMVDQGIFRFAAATGKQKQTAVLQNARFLLTGYENARFSRLAAKPDRQAAFVFSAVGKNNKSDMNFTIKGTLHNARTIEGDISATNISPDFYLPFFIKNIPIGLAGRGELESRFRYQLGSHGKDALQLEGGEFSLFDFAISRQKATQISGKELLCKGGRVNVLERRLTCEKIVLKNSKIYGGWWQKILQKPSKKRKGSWQVSCNDLDIGQSTLYGVIKGTGKKSARIRLREFTLKADNLLKSEHKEANIDASAKVGNQGQVQISGYYNLIKRDGRFLVVFNDVHLVDIKPFFSGWLKPGVLQGTAWGQGTFTLPATRFKGKIRIENFAAGENGKQILSLAKASFPDAVVLLKPLKLTADSALLERPVVNGSKQDVRELTLFVESGFAKKNNKLAPAGFAEIKKVFIENGRCDYPAPLVAPGFYPQLTDINGTISGVGPDRGILFDLSGRVNSKSAFTITGQTGLYEAYNYKLAVNKMPLSFFAPIFLKRIGVDAHKATASWQQTLESTQDEKVLMSHVDIKGLKPLPGSPYLETLALLTDANDRISFDFQSGTLDDSSDLLIEIVLQYLGRSRVKATLSPRLLLKQSFPDFYLPERISFKTGTDKAVKLDGLQDYALLLGRRPGLRLLLTGGYDEVNDKKVIRRQLLVQARKKREMEIKKWRAEEKKRLAARKKQLELINKDSKEVLVEKLDSQELNKELLSMPTEADVKVSKQLMEHLAKKRVEVVRAYLDEVLGLEGDLVLQAGAVNAQSASVSIQIQSGRR